MTLDNLNKTAWRDFLVWAWNEPEMHAQFTAKTGIVIDRATGVSERVAAGFIEWVTRDHWGIEHAPMSYQQAIISTEAKI